MVTRLAEVVIICRF